VHATNGDTFLGGEDFDKRLIDYLVEEIKSSQGVEIQNDPLAMQRLKEAAEQTKIELSSAQQTEVNLPYITADSTGPKHLVLKVTRAKLESLVQDLVERTIEPCKLALSDAGLKASDIDNVILVSGQSKMPKVQEAVEAFFGQGPRKDVNPDEAVALGAAIQAAVLSGDVDDVLLLDVTPLSLGVETMGGVMTPLIPKNTTIPTKATEVFSTADDNQSSVTVHVLQGERGTPQIEVAFDIDSNGILDVSAKDKASGKAQSITIKASSGLSEDEVQRMVKDAEDHVEDDRRFRELAQSRNQADAELHTACAALDTAADSTSDADKKTIEDAMQDLEKAIQGSDKADIDA
jgi:molecular chaperone DnaK